MTSRNTRFGKAVRKLRTAQHITLRNAAGELGISPAYLCLIEQGREGPPRPELIRDMARLLDTDPDTLFRLARTTDPELARYMNAVPALPKFLRIAMAARLTSDDFDHLAVQIQRAVANLSI